MTVSGYLAELTSYLPNCSRSVFSCSISFCCCFMLLPYEASAEIKKNSDISLHFYFFHNAHSDCRLSEMQIFSQ